MYKYSATQWIFGKEELSVSFERLKRYGYDGVELAGEPETLNFAEIRSLMNETGLVITSICGIYTAERDLSSSNPQTRRNAVNYVKGCVDMAAEFGAGVVIVVPTPVGKGAPDTTLEEEWTNVVDSLREAGEYAQIRNISLAIEALNRFETYMVNKLSAAKRLAEQVNVKSVGIMADLFHMNIEERSHRESLHLIAPHLVHVHIADNTREAAGLGMTNFKEVMRTLKEIGYQGTITMEFLPSVSNPYAAAQREEDSSNVYDYYTEQSIRHMKEVVDTIIEEV
jgi:D-psicose/D-tagatose/L-ribulose 3-epimerase